MSALPVELPIRQADEYTCSGPEGPCEPVHCEVCTRTVCQDAEHWVDPDAATLCFGEDYWHGRTVHTSCHVDCPHRECHESDDEVLESYRDRDY